MELLLPDRQIAFDPGTNHLGVSISEVDPDTGLLTPVEGHTINVLQLAETRFQDVIHMHGLLAAKHAATTHAVTRLLVAWEINVATSEGPYFRRFPQAYKALVECVLTVRNAIMAYDPHLAFTVHQPNVVKESVGVRGLSGDKDLMRKALARGLPGLDLSNIMLDDLDEHAIDALCVGYCNVRARVKANENNANRSRP